MHGYRGGVCEGRANFVALPPAQSPLGSSTWRIIENINRIRQIPLSSRDASRSRPAAFCRCTVSGIGCGRASKKVSRIRMRQRTCLAIVLAAGEGTRMRSKTPKALHPLGGNSLLSHVIKTAHAAGIGNLAVVIGPDHGAVAAEARTLAPKVQIFEQRERKGTAHAVLSARKAIEKGGNDILVVFADTPLIRPETLSKLRRALADGAAVAVLGFNPADPRGYGRLVIRRGELMAIREECDAAPEERKIAFCNGGLMALSGKHALAILNRIGNANAKGEFYLTDAVAIARDMRLK